MLNILYLIKSLLFLTNLIVCADLATAATANIADNGVNRCSGKHENPMNLDVVEVINSTLPELKVEGFREFPLTTTIFNNGHTVVVQMTFENDVPTITAGPLESAATYQLQELQFYWHKDSAVDMELHVIFFNTNYSSFEEASREQFGIAAIAANLMVSSSFYGTYEHLSKGFINIREPFTKYSLPPQSTSTLAGYLKTDLKAYYSYVGSLMAPNCSEDVIWIDLIGHIEISMETFKSFEPLKAFDGSSLTRNFVRPSQLLQNFQVGRSVPPNDCPPGKRCMIPLVDGMNKNAASKLCAKHSLDFIKILSVVNIIWTLNKK